MNYYSTTEARINFSEIMEKARYADEPSIIKKSGRFAVVVISYEQYIQYEQAKNFFDSYQKTGVVPLNNK